MSDRLPLSPQRERDAAEGGGVRACLIPDKRPHPVSLRSTTLSPEGEREALATCIAIAFPDRIARRRDASGEHWASTGGRGFRLDPAAPLARAEWLAVAETSGSAAGARILAAAALDPATVEHAFADRIETRRTLSFDSATGAVEARRDRLLGKLRLSSGPDPDADPRAIAAALLEGVRDHGLAPLRWPDAAQAWRARAAFAGVPLDDATLLARLDDWLPPLLTGKRRLDAIDAIDAGDLTQALQTLIGWDAMRTIDARAPARLETPAGSSCAIDYAAEGGPRVELRPQALFGMRDHPTVGQPPVALVLSLTSPAGRPIQTTRDLPGFWAGSWADVAREMRGRYPRHPWPDDPAAADPTLRTKRAAARRP